ncbi:MAG: HAMP domain-containing protein [Lachnospiraceae bacterium]|nr:HAMP domain-containing protein [Lachnospiraceae bacterium]
MRLFKRSMFDIMIIAYLTLTAASFGVMVLFINYSITSLLARERKDSMLSQAQLITVQYVKGYFEGDTTNFQLSKDLAAIQDVLGAEIWVADSSGQFVACSSDRVIGSKDLPLNFEAFSPKINQYQSFSTTGRFYKLFDHNTLSIGIPIINDNTYIGYIIFHSSLEDITGIEDSIQRVVLLAFLVVLLIVLLFLYHFSNKILTPIEKINKVAYDYSNGKFEKKIDIDINNEIGQLAHSLNDMADELQKVEDYRKNFISNVSHDFRSPLTSINGYLTAIQDGTIPPEKQSHYIDVVLNETKRLTKLTQGLIDLNDFNSNVLIVKKSKFDITEVIKNAVDTFEGTASKKNVHISPDIPKEALYVYADKDKISQVVNNLLDNAIKFSNPNTTIFVTALKTDHSKVKVSVKDKGVGISKEHQKHIWERFYKADSSRGRDKVGSGLGLSIVKEILKAHGEDITLISEKGHGSEFIFTLPMPASESKKGR